MDTFNVAKKVEFEDFQKMVEDVQMGGLESEDPDAKIDPLIQFPGEISMIRAYIFAMASGETNRNEFNVDNFVGSLARYGIENPVPCVSHRI